MGVRGVLVAALGVATAGLLVLLLLPNPIGSVERVAAIALLVVLVVLFCGYVLSARSRFAEISRAQDELGQQVAELRGQLDDSETLHQSLIDGVPDPVMLIDTDYNVTAINKAAQDAIGKDKLNDGPLHCYRVLHGIDAPCDPAKHECVLRTGESCKRISTRQDERGRDYLVEFQGTPLIDEAGDITGAVEVLHKLNKQERLALKLQRAKEAAQTAHRAKAQFVATMSHEVRTPMNAVLGMTDLLRLTALTRKQKSYVQVVENSGNMLLSLVDNMIDFATLESDNLVLGKESFRVTDLLEYVLEVMGYQAYSKGIELAGATELMPDVQVAGDFQRLRQIMINIVGNAIKFTETGEVIVSMAVDENADGQAQLSVGVSDSGIGMSDETASRLFLPFRSITERINRDEGGSGLGLAISKQLLDLMGGEIHVQSRLGLGTNVWFVVPVDPATQASISAVDGWHSLKNCRLLYISDRASVSAATCSFINAWDIDCEIAGTADDLSVRIAAADDAGHPFDGIVIDADVAQADQLSVARRVRGESDLPILLLTSIAQPLDVGEISSIGRIRCINKPVLPSALGHNLSRLIVHNVGEHVEAGDEQFPSLNILVAEDNPLNRKLLCNMLGSLRFKVDSVDDGLSVIPAHAKSNYDLILMDCQMPGLDGHEVTRLIREGKADLTGHPVIVAVTADVSAAQKERCLQAGMDDFLTKPIRLGTLKSGLRRWSYMAASRQLHRPEPNGRSEPEFDNLSKRIRERSGVAGEEFVNEYIDLFLDDTINRLEAMHCALEQQDLQTIQRECHALKGACLELGISNLRECCDVLGQASKDERVDDLPAAMDRLVAEFDRVRPAFEAQRRPSA